VYLLDLRLLFQRPKQIGQARHLKSALQAWKVPAFSHLREQRQGGQGKLEIQITYCNVSSCREEKWRRHALYMSVVFSKMTGFSKSALGFICEFHVARHFKKSVRVMTLVRRFL
jgi:hypothetical protein